ncbi:glycosyltransferase family 2 protein [Planctomycetota bacterium]
MNKWPKITIVTPSYNQADFLERTIQSVLKQDYPNMEYIIIDGGSTDGSVNIINKYANKLAYWVSEEDDGQADAINKGFRRATGDIVAWLNSDDEYCTGALQVIAETFMKYPDVDLVFGNRITVDENGRVLRDDRHTRFAFTTLVVLGMVLSQPASFWKRQLFAKFGYLDESQTFCMDYEFFCRISAHIKAKHIRRNLAKFRRHSSSKTCTIMDLARREHKAIRNNYLKQACRGWPRPLVVFAIHAYRAFWYTIQGDGLYVLRGIIRRLLPKRLTPTWL